MNRITSLVRELRKNQTPTERTLWKELRNRRLNGYKFLRQQPIIYGNEPNGESLFFVADFYCAEKKLVIELDGKIHDFQKDYDQNRDSILNELGLKVLRFKNKELKEIEKVKEKIADHL